MAVALAAGLAPIAGNTSVRPEIEPDVPSPSAAPIALLVNANTGQTLFAREADRRFVPASITKVMTAYLAFEWLEDGRLQLGQGMRVRPATFREWHRRGSTMFLPHDAHVSVDQLLHGIVTVSGNDASVVLAEGAAGSLPAWLRGMNAAAGELGMDDSHFGTPNGWPDEGTTFTTARDLATLAEALVAKHPARYEHFFGRESYRFNGITQQNHDPLIGVVRGADGLKTGFTNEAGYGFLGSAERDGQRLIVVVAGSDTPRARAEAARSLIEWGFQAFNNLQLFGVEDVVGTAMVQQGAELNVPLRPSVPVVLNYRGQRPPSYRLTIQYEGPVRAPVRAGDRIATLQVEIDGERIGNVPLLAGKSVSEASWIDRLRNGFAGWLR